MKDNIDICRGHQYHCWVYRRRYGGSKNLSDYVEYLQCVQCYRVYPLPEYE